MATNLFNQDLVEVGAASTIEVWQVSEFFKRLTDDYLANVYKRPPVEQNFQKRQREHAAFSLDCEMFPKVRGLIVSRAETTQSKADLDECKAAIAWLDAKMGAIR